MKTTPCEYCGYPYPHAPYEDGLVECRNELRDRLRTAIEELDAAERAVEEQRNRAKHAERELERHRHGTTTIEGDYVCPDSLRMTKYESALEFYATGYVDGGVSARYALKKDEP